MSDKLEFRKLREFGEIINDTFVFIRENFRPLLKVFIYLCGFFLLAGIAASVMQELNLQEMGVKSKSIFGFGKTADMLSWQYLLLIIFSMGIYTAVTVSTLSFIALYIQKGKVAPTPEEVWAYFRYYFFRVFFSSIFVGVFTVFCFVLCLLPGIYVFPAMSMFFSIMILENSDFAYSFSRSFKLLKDQWWATAGAVLIIWVISYACMSFASVPAVVLMMAGTFIPALGEWNVVMIVIGSILQYVSYVFMMIPIIGVTLCYFNLAERQESAGLIDRIGQLGCGKG